MPKNWKKRCRKVAAEVMGTKLDEMPIGIPFEELKCVYFSSPGEDGVSVLACSDGEFLKSDNSVPVPLHVEAFKNGLRSSR